FVLHALFTRPDAFTDWIAASPAIWWEDAGVLATGRRFAAAWQGGLSPRVLVLAPTRELAMQVAKAAQTYGRHIPGLKVATVLGGMPYPLQIRQLTGPLDILIATPGRLLD
ncbi:DEAD/DEAH box helicase, partial [Proteus mirabilis]|uniref:DEAD/DEAH box helicase n=1 Tax=Proteus mirabilis TaxID=584 RepID=UPI0013D81942